MQPTIIVAFLAGIVSVFSPCILPIIPGYFAFMSGQSRQNKTTLLHAVLFTLGFSIVFITFGAVIGSLGQFLVIHKRALEIIGGIIIILFAIQLSGLLYKIPFFRFLLKEKRFGLGFGSSSSHSAGLASSTGLLKSLLAGIVFAFGYSPCYGPILGSIFTLALAETSFNKGILLFGAYALGMALTFVTIAILASKASNAVNKTKKFSKYFGIIMSIFLLLLGISMLSGNTSYLANLINNMYTEFNLNIF
ncbi:MAG: cytochrome c biogenesis CcdA family protein [Candidatus Gracilibacteria bacterium]